MATVIDFAAARAKRDARRARTAQRRREALARTPGGQAILGRMIARGAVCIGEEHGCWCPRCVDKRAWGALDEMWTQLEREAHRW